MGKMANTVQAKSKARDTSVFHSGLIRILVMEKLKKINLTWKQFLVSANIQLEIDSTPQSRVKIPFLASSVSQEETSKKRKNKPIPKKNKFLRKLNKKRGKSITPHRENFHLILHLN
jgi:hypothetical protein